MTDDIIRQCANHLRTSLTENHNITLKTSHAHEIVAALFGYKSKASMLADKKYPITKLAKSELMMFERAFSCIDKRMEALNDLPDGLPNNDVIAETVYALFENKSEGQRQAYTNFEDMAIELAKPYLQSHLNKMNVSSDLKEFSTEVNTEVREDKLILTVSFNTLETPKYCFVEILFPRVAGCVGYGKYKITPLYTDERIKIDIEEILNQFEAGDKKCDKVFCTTCWGKSYAFTQNATPIIHEQVKMAICELSLQDFRNLSDNYWGGWAEFLYKHYYDEVLEMFIKEVENLDDMRRLEQVAFDFPIYHELMQKTGKRY